MPTKSNKIRVTGRRKRKSVTKRNRGATIYAYVTKENHSFANHTGKRKFKTSSKFINALIDAARKGNVKFPRASVKA